VRQPNFAVARLLLKKDRMMSSDAPMSAYAHSAHRQDRDRLAVAGYIASRFRGAYLGNRHADI